MSSRLDRLNDHVIYRRVAPVVLVVTLILGVGAVVGTYVNDRNDRERDREIDRVQTAAVQRNAELLECFDKFATDLAGGLPPVRAATGERDDALARALKQLQRVLIRALTGNAELEDAQQLVQTLQAYQTASNHLNDVRADNPYPDPPSTFCGAS